MSGVHLIVIATPALCKASLVVTRLASPRHIGVSKPGGSERLGSEHSPPRSAGGELLAARRTLSSVRAGIDAQVMPDASRQRASLAYAMQRGARSTEQHTHRTSVEGRVRSTYRACPVPSGYYYRLEESGRVDGKNETTETSIVSRPHHPQRQSR